MPELVKRGDYTPSNGFLDQLTKDFIHKNLSYRFVSIETENSDTVVRRLENQIKSGVLGFSPTLNGS